MQEHNWIIIAQANVPPKSMSRHFNDSTELPNNDSNELLMGQLLSMKKKRHIFYYVGL